MKKIYNKSIPLVYWNEPNFGDILSPYILSRLSDREIVHKECFRGNRYVVLETIKRLTGYIKKPLKSINYPFERNLLAVGSIISWGNNSSVVWGSGFMNTADKFNGEYRILAVRGKYTDEKLEKMGYNKCGVYGDPALLLPLVYKPQVKKRHEIGIIPHITEADYFIGKYSEDYKVIDLRTFDVEQVIDDICSCDCILSTSLHGIIVAHTYGIPAVWIKKNYINTDGFKFNDYFSSVDIPIYKGVEDYEELIVDKASRDIFLETNKNIVLPNCSLETLRTNLLSVAPFDVKFK